MLSIFITSIKCVFQTIIDINCWKMTYNHQLPDSDFYIICADFIVCLFYMGYILLFFYFISSIIILVEKFVISESSKEIFNIVKFIRKVNQFIIILLFIFTMIISSAFFIIFTSCYNTELVLNFDSYFKRIQPESNIYSNAWDKDGIVKGIHIVVIIFILSSVTLPLFYTFYISRPIRSKFSKDRK